MILHHLNQAGSSWPLPEPVRAAMNRAMDRGAHWRADFEQWQAEVAAGLGCEPKNLLLTPSGTSALAVAIADVPLAPGQRILTSSMPHHALARPVNRRERAGIVHHPLPRAPSGPLDLEALETELARGHVGLVALSAAVNLTGEIIDPRPVSEACARAGVPLIWDAAQVAGWLPLQPWLDGSAAVCFTGHKGLQGAWGIGGLIRGDDALWDTPTASCDPTDDSSCRLGPGYCDTGSVNRLALAGLAAAIRWLDEEPRRTRLEQGRALIGELEQRLKSQEDLTRVESTPLEDRLPILALSYNGDPGQLRDRLLDLGVEIGAGAFCAPMALQTLGHPEGLIRISVGPQTCAEDLQALVAGLDTCSRRP